jgi:cell wall integrity and stress response component
MKLPSLIVLLGTIASILESDVVLAQSTAAPSAAPTDGFGDLTLKAMTLLGCYSTSDPLVDQGSYQFQTQGYCQKVCVKNGNKPVMGLTQGSNCWCGDVIPAGKADNSSCNSPCLGYDKDDCGGDGFWTVYLTGVDNSVGSVDGASGSSKAPSGTKSASPSVITIGGQTVVVTAGSNAGGKTGSGGPSKAGIAAGVVVGLVLLAAAIIGGWLFMRKRQRHAVEEEYRRTTAVNSFVLGGKSAGTGSYPSSSDSRLEPSVMMQRRQSDGSIADNQDYSRRILKVTNPDR